MIPEFDKEHYKRLKQMAKQFKVHLVHQNLTRPDRCPGHLYNGLTVAYSPATELDNNRMIEVSVSYCAPEDKFKKKIGRYHALRKFFEENNYVHIPLGKSYRYNGTVDTGAILLGMFTV
jgi:hypothetical protein